MIINRSFISEVLRTTIAVTFVIVSIFLVMRVMGFLSQAAEGLLPIGGVLSLVALKMVAYLDVMIPLMFYIALLMVLNRWYTDKEIAVLASAGVGITHFLRPLAILVLFVNGVVVFCAFFLTPMSLERGYDLERGYRQSREVSGIVTGKFLEAKGGNGVYFVEDYNRSTGNYEGVFVYRASFKREGVVVSQEAYRMEDPNTQDQFLVLLNGSRYEGNPGSPDYRVIDFEKYALRLEPANQTTLALPIRARSNTELMESDVPSFRSEWYWRIAKIFTLPILALFALGLSHVDSRKGKSSGLTLAFMVYLTYTNLLGYTVALVKKGESLTGTPIWLVHGIYFLLAVYCLYRRNYNLPLIPAVRIWRKAAPL
ncbi:MAG: LPS export ABC transporter permease LptF [Arenicella sp.]|jgi:lipopolysaccharide export system permease protein|nr:LPS export ABC transporter permease LptF [Arenicella sp.]